MMERAYCERIYPYLALIRIPYVLGGEGVSINTYLVIDEELLLIDAGPWSKDYRDILSSALRQLGFSIGDISQIIYTHTHPDHMGGGIEFNGQQKLTHSVYWEAQERVEPYGQYVHLLKTLSKESFLKHLLYHPFERNAWLTVADSLWDPTFGKIRIKHGLREGEIFHTGKLKLEIIFTPGHTPWDISLWEEDKALLFSGDFLMKKSTAFGSGLNGLGSDLGVYGSSLKKIKSTLLKTKCVFPSHGPFVTSCSNLADDFSGIIKQREDKILKQLSIKKQTLMGLINALFSSDRSAIDLTRQLGVVLTHLEKLEKEDRVNCTEEDGNIFYALA